MNRRGFLFGGIALVAATPVALAAKFVEPKPKYPSLPDGVFNPLEWYENMNDAIGVIHYPYACFGVK